MIHLSFENWKNKKMSFKRHALLGKYLENINLGLAMPGLLCGLSNL